MVAQTATSQHHILEQAALLFQKRGYDGVNMLDIAEASNMPVDAVVADYHDTAHVALALYHQLADETLGYSKTLLPGTFSQRYTGLLAHKIAQLTPHEDAISALFASAMRVNSAISTTDISPGLDDPIYKACVQAIKGATDAPRSSNEQSDLALLLYTFHFLVLIFWVYDRTPEKRGSQMFIKFLGDFFKMLRPVMMMPMFSKGITKMTTVMMLVFGGARLVDEAETNPQ